MERKVAIKGRQHTGGARRARDALGPIAPARLGARRLRPPRHCVCGPVASLYIICRRGRVGWLCNTWILRRSESIDRQSSDLAAGPGRRSPNERL